jgi:hypothetical protein
MPSCLLSSTFVASNALHALNGVVQQLFLICELPFATCASGAPLAGIFTGLVTRLHIERDISRFIAFTVIVVTSRNGVFSRLLHTIIIIPVIIVDVCGALAFALGDKVFGLGG